MYLLWRSALLFVVCTMCLVDFSFEFNKRIVYIDMERPHVKYENPKYIKIFNMSATRSSRRDPVHYVVFCAQIFITFDNNIRLNVHVDEFLSNDYRPTFVRTSFKLCEFLKYVNQNVYKSKNITIPVTRYELDLNICHEEPAIYCMKNMSMPVSRFPQQFPFEKGRVFFNCTYKDQEVMFSGYIDLEVKMLPITRYKGKD